jgi:hypothetical protein
MKLGSGLGSAWKLPRVASRFWLHAPSWPKKALVTTSSI